MCLIDLIRVIEKGKIKVGNKFQMNLIFVYLP